MNWLEMGLAGSVIFALYYCQQIKITLKGKGYDVDPFTGWFADYKRFKQLIHSETDQNSKLKCQGILNGLHLALVGGTVIAYFLLAGKFGG